MLKIGEQITLSLMVTSADTALAMHSGSLAVLATPRLIALCEEAACELVASSLIAGQTTVGTRIDLQHQAPTSIGGVVTVTCTLTAQSDHHFNFDLVVTDDQRQVAVGQHERVKVDATAFMAKVDSM